MNVEINNTARRPAPELDPLLTVITTYRTGIAAYDSKLRPVDDHAAESLYRPALEMLQNWTDPATTWQSAMAALKLACQELDESGDIDLARPMANAALGFFGNEGSIAFQPKRSLPSISDADLDSIYHVTAVLEVANSILITGDLSGAECHALATLIHDGHGRLSGVLGRLESPDSAVADIQRGVFA